MAAQLSPLPEVERLSPRVIRILGGNPGKFTLQGTNTYLLGTGYSRLLIDTGQSIPSWSRALSRILSAESCTIGTCLLTHWHHDHTHGVPDLLALCPSARIYKSQPDLNPPPLPTLPGASAPRLVVVEDIRDGETFAAEGVTLRAISTPGHTADHFTFLLQEESALFTGDCVLGHGTAVFEDLGIYLHSLRGLEKRDDFTGRAYPGHGPLIEDGKARMREYIAHRAEREAQVLEQLGRGLEGEGATEDGGLSRGKTAREMVRVIYADVPENLHDAAEGGVRQILLKLQKEERVLYNADGGTWSLARRDRNQGSL